ncbi:deazaflavin-dependent oxidoreductase (nitroreductase family) [Mycobacterium frederiksbergense]|uniref:Deazaflavin-dependent oxidoreductase (Nitroreductase family) n=1 Tax=Mycolicibacterium frederiksbergense TaxID=117567 RepID=A0ABT6L7N1_9MYCO|nr:nitroreductase family deazaflavin-dependent oxidoreductase [Mycolicibacterium frederiksbergense]MDH6198959.1 deazaflavin-dependent oxidoreductase (nitroreductase family) [Mycolicibacterium frederiksbergense]
MPSSIANSIALLAERIATILGPRVMRVIARFNKYVTNPLQRLWAPYLPYMAVIEHIGRTSGKPYRTPVMAFVHARSVSVVLNYGERSDWVRNIKAAGGAGVVHRGRRYQLTNPRIIPAGDTDQKARFVATLAPRECADC